MSDGLRNVLKEHSDLLLDSVIRQLSASDADHYQQLQGGQLRNRMEMMHESFVHASATRSDAFTAYIMSITGERFSEGFALHEVQLALRVYEESVWRLVTVHVPQDEQVACLAHATSIIGAAKDELANAYLSLLEYARTGVRGDCSGGTDSPPLTEEDRADGNSLARRIASLNRMHRHEDTTPAGNGR